MPPRKKLPKKPRVTPGVYWHGGPTGLSIGDMIIPANELVSTTVELGTVSGG